MILICKCNFNVHDPMYCKIKNFYEFYLFNCYTTVTIDKEYKQSMFYLVQIYCIYIDFCCVVLCCVVLCCVVLCCVVLCCVCIVHWRYQIKFLPFPPDKSGGGKAKKKSRRGNRQKEKKFVHQESLKSLRLFNRENYKLK